MTWVEFLNGVWLASLRLVLPSLEYQSPPPPLIFNTPIVVHYRILGVFNSSRGMGGKEQGEGIIIGTADRLCSWVIRFSSSHYWYPSRVGYCFGV